MATADERRFQCCVRFVADFVATKETDRLDNRWWNGITSCCLVGDGSQRHGRAGSRGLHRPATHQLRTSADGKGLPRIRRPARRRSSRCRGLNGRAIQAFWKSGVRPRPTYCDARCGYWPN